MVNDDLAKKTYYVFVTVIKTFVSDYKVIKYEDLPNGVRIAWKAAIEFALNN